MTGPDSDSIWLVRDALGERLTESSVKHSHSTNPASNPWIRNIEAGTVPTGRPHGGPAPRGSGPSPPPPDESDAERSVAAQISLNFDLTIHVPGGANRSRCRVVATSTALVLAQSGHPDVPDDARLRWADVTCDRVGPGHLRLRHGPVELLVTGEDADTVACLAAAAGDGPLFLARVTRRNPFVPRGATLVAGAARLALVPDLTPLGRVGSPVVSMRWDDVVFVASPGTTALVVGTHTRTLSLTFDSELARNAARHAIGGRLPNSPPAPHDKSPHAPSR
jgi:hypothetical protein